MSEEKHPYAPERCPTCMWSNTGLLNYGTPGKSRWLCHGCAARLIQVQDLGAVPMILTCPTCNARHIDEGEFATKAHHTHACQCCGMVWRPALVPTVGVQFLPGFKNG